MSESVICTMKLEDWTRLEMKLLGNEANLALSWSPGLALMALKKKISFIGTFLKLGDCPWTSRFLVSSAKSKSEFPGKFWPLRLPSASHVSCLQIGRHCSPSSFLFCSTWWRWFLEATFLRAVLSVWWPEENGVCAEGRGVLVVKKRERDKRERHTHTEREREENSSLSWWGGCGL